MGTLKIGYGYPPGVPERDPRLCQAFESASRVFWCNTNRDAGAGGNCLEQRMHDLHFAAAWTWGAGTDQAGTFNYPKHMQRVRRGDLIVMYANELVIIAIGQAMGDVLPILFQNDPGRMRDYATEGENAE